MRAAGPHRFSPRASPKILLHFALLIILVCVPRLAIAAPQTFNTALPVAVGEFILRGQLVYKKASEDPTNLKRDITVWGGTAVLGYGVVRNLALFGVLPVFDKEMKLIQPNGERVRRSTSGFADARLFGRLTLFQKDGQGRSFRIAPFAGLELPTGSDNASDTLGRLPAMLQMGSGSWDPFFGVVLTHQTLDYQIDAQVAYKANMSANNFEFGDDVRLDASAQYRLWPRELGSGVPGFLYLGFEANFIHQNKNQIADDIDPNSGGNTLFVSPSLQYVTKRWVLETVIQLPITQDLNGTAVEDDLSVRAGFRVNF